MAKIKTLGTVGASTTSVVLGAREKVAHDIFNGKSLAEVGAEYDLDDTDVTIGFNVNPNNNEEIASLVIKVKGTKYSVPFSRNYSVAEATADADSLLNGRFRVNFMSVKNAQGEATDEFTTTAYMSFGKPGGLTIGREEKAFAVANTASAATA